MISSRWRAPLLAIILLLSMLALATCSSQGVGPQGQLYVQDLTARAQEFAGKAITVDGAYLWRPGDPAISLLAVGVSTLDNGLDAQPLGDPIWVDGFPAEATANLHRPGDAVYGFVRVSGQFETGGTYGPNGQYRYRLQVNQVQPIEQIQRVEHRLNPNDAPPANQVALADLLRDPNRFNGQVITVRGYYFWNSVIYVLAEGVSTEEDGTSPQPIGQPIWMEGFPPDQSEKLNLGPNNSYVWGAVEVTGHFQTGGGFGKDAAYASLFTVQSAIPLEQSAK